MKDLNRLARGIVANNQYLTLGTVNQNGVTWVSPVVYVFDNEYNFCWISLPSSQHSQNIQKNNQVTFAIFDSHQKFGTGVGLQVQAQAQKVPFTKSLPLIALYFKRQWPYGPAISKDSFRHLITNKIYSFYQATPTKIWINDPRVKTDIRVEVKLT